MEEAGENRSVSGGLAVNRVGFCVGVCACVRVRVAALACVRLCVQPEPCLLPEQPAVAQLLGPILGPRVLVCSRRTGADTASGPVQSLRRSRVPLMACLQAFASADEIPSFFSTAINGVTTAQR